MAAKVWDMVPNDMKKVNDIETFKTNIRKRKPVNCHCKLCLDYVSCVGYVNTFQARNQEFFRAGEVSENKSTSINTFNLQHTKEKSHREKFRICFS